MFLLATTTTTIVILDTFIYFYLLISSTLVEKQFRSKWEHQEKEVPNVIKERSQQPCLHDDY
jgi:hypothetical protein